MKALFVNYPEPACGVHQFGVNLAAILKGSNRIDWYYAQPQTREELHTEGYDVVVYNWIDGQGGFLCTAPFPDVKCKQMLVYHDGIVSGAFDAALFSDPTMPPRDRWHSMGRPLPQWTPQPAKQRDEPVIGVHGFRGAQADRVVAQVLKDFKSAHIRLLLPFSHYCDPHGIEALSMAEKCRMAASWTNVTLDISHQFLGQDQMLQWLSDNDLNCYIRDPATHWRGVSSAPDAALAVRRPIAVNLCNAFRHLHFTEPSICVEHSSLSHILAMGTKPLEPLYEQWSAENVCKQVDDAILGL